MKEQTNSHIVKILVEKSLDDLNNLKIEAKQKNLNSQLGRWYSLYMQSLQNTNFEVYKIVMEKYFNEYV